MKNFLLFRGYDKKENTISQYEYNIRRDRMAEENYIKEYYNQMRERENVVKPNFWKKIKMFFKKFLFIFFFLGMFSSCNPKMYIVGGIMRNHNLSQNKYQPGKQRKQVKVHRRFPVFFLLQNR